MQGWTAGRGDFCETCGNQMDPMGPNSWGCLSCYMASGPDGLFRWICDCAVAEHEAPTNNVLPFRPRAARHRLPRRAHPDFPQPLQS